MSSTNAFGMKKPNGASRLRKGATALAVTAMLVTMSAPNFAFAEGGSGGEGGDGYNADSSTLTLYDKFFDNDTHDQGAGMTSFEWFAAKMKLPKDRKNDAYYSLQRTCGAALEEARQRGIAAGADSNVRSRVVGIMFASFKGKAKYGRNAYRSPGVFRNALKKWQNDGYPGLSGAVAEGEWPDYIYQLGQAGVDKGVADSNVPSQPTVKTVCIALNDNEPKDPSYDLTVTTNHGAPADMEAGSTVAVSDVIHASAKGADKESLNASVVLNYDGPEGNKAVTKAVTISNNGDTRTPNFTPADFGWASWPATFGDKSFWFDVKVPKQGNMNAAVDTADREATESFKVKPKPPVKVITNGTTGNVLEDQDVLAAGMFYNASVTAHSNGYESSMTITDSINTEDVFIGGKDADVTSAVSVVGPDGNKIANPEISVERSGGKTVVKATVKGMTVQGDYTMVVPTYTLPTHKDYTIPDDSSVDYGPNHEGRLNGNSEETRKVTPAPDKVWVLDENGGLTTADPERTNQKGADQKLFIPGSEVSAVVNGHVPAHLQQNFSSYEIVDDWTNAAKYVDFTNASKAKVYYNGKDVTSQFTVKVEGTKTIATAKSEFLAKTANLDADAVVKLIISGAFKTDYATQGKTVKLTNGGYESWNNEKQETNVPPVFTRTPYPDKVWVLDENGGLTTADPDRTNTKGMDQRTFLPGSEVSAVVNGVVPAHLSRNLTNYEIVDDWTNAAKYVDFTNASKAKVYYNGKDVTSQFTVKVEGTKTIATAKSEFLAKTADLKSDGAVKLVISGAFRDDYRTHGEKVKLTNGGYETWNKVTTNTNVPPVFTWTPDPHKQVIGTNAQDGDHVYASIDGMNVWPGQKVEYTVQLDLNIPDQLARGIKSLAMRDNYDPMLALDKSSIEIYDSRTNRPIAARGNYTVAVDEKNHNFMVTFTDKFIADNTTKLEDGSVQWNNGGTFIARFTGTVKKDAKAGSKVENTAYQLLNNVAFETETPVVHVPGFDPHKEDLNTSNKDIDGKTVVEGDILRYRLTLDGGPAKTKLAYFVHKLGMVDDYDEDYLDLAPEAIHVYDKDSGDDVTDQFNISVKDGKFYVFAKQVDSVNNWGEELKGDPQPTDLAAYDSAGIEPNKTPIINQDLLGHDFYITADAVVKKETDGYTIVNQARQNLENVSKQTEIVSNPLKDIDPVKDVVVDESSKDDSINGTEVKLDSTFNYRLRSSEIPANRAYGVRDWGITDTFDKKHDSFTGIWAVYADTDIYDGDKLVFKKGDLLTDSAAHESEVYGQLFTAEYDTESATLSVKATDKFMKLVNTRGDLAQAFSVYTKMERIAPAEKVVNTFDETYNGHKRHSNEVWTHTPEHPAIDIEKYTLREGVKKGDRDEVAQAFPIDDAKKLFAQAHDDAKADAKTAEPTAEASAEAKATAESTSEPLAETVKKAVASMTSEAAGVSAAASEEATKEASAEATPKASTEASAEPTAEATSESKAEKPKADVEEASDGIEVGFDITNTGDVPLTKLTFADATINDTVGKVDGIIIAVPVEIAKASGLAKNTTGKVYYLSDAKELAKVILPVGAKMQAFGTLTGMKPGSLHSDTAKVVGHSVYTGKTVEDSDSWHAKLAGHPKIDVEKYTLSEGLKKGDRDAFKDALVLNEKQAKDGTKIGFLVTNTGDVNLYDVTLSDQTWDNSTGVVKNITCKVPAKAATTPEAVKATAEKKASPEAKPEATAEAKAKATPEATKDAADKTAATKEAPAKPSAEAKSDAKPEATAEATAEAQKADAKAKGTVIGEMKPGEKVECEGVLEGMEPGTAHSDTATVVGKTGDSDPNGSQTVTDKDNWHAKVPTKDVPNPPEPDGPNKGAVTGEAHGDSNPILGWLGALLAACGLGAGAYGVRRQRKVTKK